MFIKNYKEIFYLYCRNAKLKGTFAEPFYNRFTLLEGQHKLIHSPQQILIQYLVPKETCNIVGIMHGGALSTLVDISTTLAILKVDIKLRKNLTIEQSYSCLSQVNQGDSLLIRAECIKQGKTIAFTECKIFKENSLQVVLTGQQNKFFFNETWDPEMVKRLQLEKSSNKIKEL